MSSEESTSVFAWNWKSLAQLAALGIVEAALWALIEGFPKWVLIITIILGLLSVGTLNINVKWRWFKLVPFVLGLLYIAVIGYELAFKPESTARIRILNVVAVPMSESGAAFPAMNIYYDIVGQVAVTGVVSRFGAGFGGHLSDESMVAEQDKLLRCDGWKSAMERRRQHELHPGDPGEFTTIPNMKDQLAEQFRTNWGKVDTGETVLYIFITFKCFDPAGRVIVTENCFWFSGGFARHECGRGRTFVEH